MVLWTLSVLAGPLLVRYGIDQGITRHDYAALDGAVAAYVVVAICTYFVYRRLVVDVSLAGEGFLRDLRTRVFDHLQLLSMPFYDREKAGVLVSRMTSDVDSLAELVQMGLLMFLMNGLLLCPVADRAGHRVVAAAARVPAGGAAGRGGEHPLPARVEPGLPARARPHRPHPVHACRRASRGSG